MTGTIAPTDYRWYQFLVDRSHSWKEVNFWTPSTHFAFRADEFSPFLFKLKAPYNAICGYGLFTKYAPLPDWLAWECFGHGNGCVSLLDMRERISQIRERMKFAGPPGLAQIGCIAILDVTLFPAGHWIPQPSSWPPRNLRPMRYSLDEGEGARIWAECLARRGAADLIAPLEGTSNRYGQPIVIRPRLGQGAFRLAVTAAYERACAITGEHSLPALDAVHIRPFACDGPHTVSNGMLLRADIHRLLEQGYVTVTPQLNIEVSGRLRIDYNNGKSYYPLHGRSISTPLSSADHLDPDVLRWHNDNVFLG